MFFLFGRPRRLEAFNDTSWPQEWLGDGSMSGPTVGRHPYFASQFSDIDCADAWGVIFPVAAATVQVQPALELKKKRSRVRPTLPAGFDWLPQTKLTRGCLVGRVCSVRWARIPVDGRRQMKRIRGARCGERTGCGRQIRGREGAREGRQFRWWNVQPTTFRRCSLRSIPHFPRLAHPSLPLAAS